MTPDRLTVFRVTLVTHWSRDKFPKQYPEWRPPAQWSKLIGKFELKLLLSKASIKNRGKMYLGNF